MTDTNKNLYNRLFKKQEGKCVLCGRKEPTFDLVHLNPAGQEDKTSVLTNYALICRTHERLSNPHRIREFEYRNFLRRILESNEDFEIWSDYHIDIPPTARLDLYIRDKRHEETAYAVEVKSFSTYIGHNIDRIIDQLNHYESKLSNVVRKVFALPGVLSDEEKQKFNLANIEVWDLQYLFDNYREEMMKDENQKFFKYYSLIDNVEDLMFERKLIKELKEIEPGKKNWSRYQNHIGKIIDYLFADILSAAIPESSDENKINRRDFILRNYTADGFWKYLRSRYNADFIVIDAKNYKGGVKKREINQIANYLKKGGTGTFALIISRVEENRNAYLTRRDKWLLDEKMLVVLTDDDICKMILAKAASNDPEEIIKQRIEEFRLKI